MTILIIFTALYSKLGPLNTILPEIWSLIPYMESVDDVKDRYSNIKYEFEYEIRESNLKHVYVFISIWLIQFYFKIK